MLFLFSFHTKIVIFITFLILFLNNKRKNLNSFIARKWDFCQHLFSLNTHLYIHSEWTLVLFRISAMYDTNHTSDVSIKKSERKREKEVEKGEKRITLLSNNDAWFERPKWQPIMSWKSNKFSPQIDFIFIKAFFHSHVVLLHSLAILSYTEPTVHVLVIKHKYLTV